MQSLFRISLLALGVGVSLHARAQVQPEVVVTADRVARTVDDTLAAVSVITRDDIEASGSNDVFDLLRQVPGLDLARGGGLGQQTSVFLRGTNSNHVLVLMDGVRVSAAGTGAFAWEQLSLEQIERIEVVRGPRAALWGSDALGGVIQIFTRRADGVDGAVSLGNHDAWGANVGAGARDERGGFDARVGYADARGTNSQNPEGFSFDPDDDGYIYRNAMLHGDVALGDHVLSAMASRRDNDIEFDQGESSTQQSQYSLALDGAISSDWTQHAQVAATRDTLDTPAFFSRYETSREQLDWNHALQLRERTELLFGLAYLRERGENIDGFSGEAIYDERRHNRAVFGSLRQGAGAHEFEASVRHDDNSTFGGESTFAAAWGWQLAEGARTTLSYGEGFRAPSLNELYSPGFGGLFAGNPKLDPEHSKHVEAGLRLGEGEATLDLRAWSDRIDNLVDFSGGDTFQAVNIKRARLRGVEAEGRWRPAAEWEVSAHATWQDAEDRDTGSDLLRRAPRKGGATVERLFGNGARLGLEGFASARRPEFGGALPGYGLLTLRGSVPLGGQWWLDGRVDNLLDRDYSLLRGYNTPGMTALATLRWGVPAR